MLLRRIKGPRAPLRAFLAAAIVGLGCFSGLHSATALELSLPIKCEINTTCFVQNYVDNDPTDKRRDFACGQATYDGHKGTDFRLVTTGDVVRDIGVFAAADGTVKGLRDGMPDRLVGRKASGSVAGRECGNGVVIDHGEGWETQYCHLKRGSVSVQKGRKVARGAKLGAIGFSGQAQFAHVHIEVRHNGKVIDPFTAKERNDTCGLPERTTTAKGLWTPDVAAVLQYRTGQIIETGFAGDVPKRPQSEAGLAALLKPEARSKALVFLVRAINLVEGDGLKMTVTGPKDFKIENTKIMKRARASFGVFVGKTLRDKPRWVAGKYRAEAVIIRDGRAIDRKQNDIVIE